MRDAGIYSTTVNAKEMKKRLDLIFCSVNRNKSNMDFEHFLQALVKVAEAKYGDASPNRALRALLDDHMLPLSQKVYDQQQLCAQSKVLLAQSNQQASIFEFDELVSILLRDVGRVLLTTYQLYFEHEIKCTGVQSESEILRTSQKNLFNLLKEFDICPGIVAKQ